MSDSDNHANVVAHPNPRQAGVMPDSAKIAQRIDVERTLYRPEVFEYQRSLSLSEPVDERALPALWCLLPGALLIFLCWLFSSATYRPRANASASTGPRPGIVVLSFADAGRDFIDVHPGNAATIRINAGTPHRMTVGRTTPCAAPSRCLEIEGRIDGPGELLSIPRDMTVPVEVVLSARALVW